MNSRNGFGIKRLSMICVGYFMFSLARVFGQEAPTAPVDSSKSVISISSSVPNDDVDSLVQKAENSPLDITEDRGLYIVADEGNLQMRIVGSIRFSAFYDNANLDSKNSFNTYDLPTGDENYRIPNYYNSLNFSRIGFEITRKTSTENIFIRIETDFAGANNSYRIRHAYGQYGKWLVGQTWSLLTNVTSLPATVDPDGPVGSISSRTPQIRYTTHILNKIVGSLAVEYSLADFTPQDTIDINFLQTFPNLAARVNMPGFFGNLQISGVVAPITGVDGGGNKNTTFGFGASVSGAYDLPNKDQLLVQATYGNAIAHFMSPFQGKGQDMAYDPNTARFAGLRTAGGFVSYHRHWGNDVSSYISAGWANISNRSAQNERDFNYSYSISGNAFWNIVEGMRIGLEYVYGKRINIDKTNGDGSRVWALFYYDF